MSTQQTQREAPEGDQYALNYHQVPTGARQQAHPHMYNGGPSRQGIPARSTTITPVQDPYYSYWDYYHAYYYARQYPRPMDQAQYAYPTPARPPVQPEANQAQPSQTFDFAKELTTILKNLPTDLKTDIDQTLTTADILQNMYDINWDKLLVMVDWSRYSGDALAQALGEFFYVKEMWMQDRERQEQRRGKRQP